MICKTNDRIFKWVRADGGWDLGSPYMANGRVVTTMGLKLFADLRPTDSVQMKTACDGPTWFVEWGRLEETNKRTD